jgi:hypothetical protein
VQYNLFAMEKHSMSVCLSVCLSATCFMAYSRVGIYFAVNFLRCGLTFFLFNKGRCLKIKTKKSISMCESDRQRGCTVHVPVHRKNIPITHKNTHTCSVALISMQVVQG